MASTNSMDEGGRDSMTSDKSEMSKSKKQREYQFYMEMFSQLLDIVDAISTQMFEKVSVIPYSIR